MINIETNRLLLRNFVEEDKDDVFRYCSQRGIGEMAGWPRHETIEDTKKVLSGWIKNENKLAIVWKENGKVIGHIAIDEDSEEGRIDTKELGCALNRDYHRRGIMSEAMVAVIHYLFDHDISYIWACCFKENIASKALIEKCGFVFQQEGEFYSERLDRNFQSYEYCLEKDRWKRNSRDGV